MVDSTRNAEAQTVVCSVNHIKSYLEAEIEEKKKSSFLCLSTSAFRFLEDIFAEPNTPKTRETK